MTPSDPCLLKLFGSLLPNGTEAGLCNQEYRKNDVVGLLGWGSKRHCGFPHIPLAHFFCGKQPLCYEVTWTALWGGPRGERLRSSANSQHQLASPVREPHWTWMTATSQNPQPDPSGWTAPECMPIETVQVSRCLLWLHLEVIDYV